jgi:hypothetical protein
MVAGLRETSAAAGLSVAELVRIAVSSMIAAKRSVTEQATLRDLAVRVVEAAKGLPPDSTRKFFCVDASGVREIGVGR